MYYPTSYISWGFPHMCLVGSSPIKMIIYLWSRWAWRSLPMLLHVFSKCYCVYKATTSQWSTGWDVFTRLQDHNEILDGMWNAPSYCILPVISWNSRWDPVRPEHSPHTNHTWVQDQCPVSHIWWTTSAWPHRIIWIDGLRTSKCPMPTLTLFGSLQPAYSWRWNHSQWRLHCCFTTEEGRYTLYSVPYMQITKASQNAICKTRAVSTDWLWKWTSNNPLRPVRCANTITLSCAPSWH